MPSSDWVMHLYKADVDANEATPYKYDLITTIDNNAGYATHTPVYITQSGRGYMFRVAHTEDVTKSAFGATYSRLFWRVVLSKYSFDASSNPDLDNEDALRNFLHGAHHLWVRFEAGSRDQPNTTNAYPVNLMEWSDDVVTQDGTHGVQIRLEHKYEMDTYL